MLIELLHLMDANEIRFCEEVECNSSLTHKIERNLLIFLANKIHDDYLVLLDKRNHRFLVAEHEQC